MRGLLLFLLASAALAGEEWPSARGDPLNSGVTKNRGPLATPQVAWKREEKDAISAGVALAAGRLAYGVGEFVVAYREASDGRDVWEYVTYSLIGLAPVSALASAVEFFIYDTIKIFALLSVIIFAVSVIRSYFPPERTRAILSHKKEFIGNIFAALLGVVTPFCSCSAVPLFIGFVEAGVPLGVTLSFLISSPMVNEVAVVLLWGLFGWKVALIYAGTGLIVAIVAGLVIGKLKLEKWVEEYVYQFQSGGAQEILKQTFRERLEYAKLNTADILKRVWLFIVIAIGVRLIWN